MLTKEKKLELERFSKQIQMKTIETIASLGVGHVGGALSIADLLAVLYGKQMNVRPEEPRWEDRDWLVVSKGHAGPAVYSALALRGFFPLEQLYTLNQSGTHLPSHCDRNLTTGIDITTGSLGQGASSAAGVALALQKDKKDSRVFLILGDGEIQEGQVWEASMFAGHRKLDNLVVIVDNNGLQIDGSVADVCSPYPIDKKFEAFNFHVIADVDAHDFEALRAAFKEARETKGMPTAIILKSVKGKGVSFMENKAGWHGKAPNDEEYAIAMDELEKAGEALCQK